MDGKKLLNNEMAICCFCGEQLLFRESIILVVYPNPGEDESQNLCCHRKCFSKLLHDSIPLHPDLWDENNE